MAIHDFNAQRLYTESDLAAGAGFVCEAGQANYLLNVLRLKTGDSILVFNGRDGEWRARVAEAGKRRCTLEPEALVRAQPEVRPLHYCFAPLKRGRLDYMVQKAVEMGASHLQPVLTRRTIAERVNLDRMRANAIEAAEQCGILSLPEIGEPVKLASLIANWPAGRQLVFCDESAPISNPIDALAAIPQGETAVLIGPEGGFAEEERRLLLDADFAFAISLGPRIMRADTAAVAALAVVNAVRGDWRAA